MQCHDCLVSAHRDLPLHRIEVRYYFLLFDLLLLKVYYRSGMAIFLLRLPFKILVFVSNSGMAVLRVPFHPPVPQISATFTHLESITSPSTSVTVGRVGSSINALSYCVLIGSLPLLIALGLCSPLTASTCFMSSHISKKVLSDLHTANDI